MSNCPAHGEHPHNGRECLDCSICRPLDEYQTFVSPPPPLERAEVEALMNENGARITALTNRGVHLDGGEILMTRIKAMLDHLIGDMDSQPRLRFEFDLAMQYKQAIDATEPQVERAILAQRLNGGGMPPTSPGGIILPS